MIVAPLGSCFKNPRPGRQAKPGAPLRGLPGCRTSRDICPVRLAALSRHARVRLLRCWSRPCGSEGPPMKTTAATTALGIALSGCATTFSVQDVAPVEISASNALKLNDYPANRDYKTMGTIRLHAYRAGLSQPTPDDVWAEISRAVASKGGNACLLRGSQPDDIFQRQIWVTCEVLSVSDIRKLAPVAEGAVPPARQPTSVQGAPAAAPAPRATFRPAACDWPGAKQGVGAC